VAALPHSESWDDLDRVQQVDQQIDLFQRQHGEGFYRLVRSRGLCHDDARDVLQDSLLAFRHRLIDKGPVEDPNRYFHRILFHQIVDFHRRRNRLGEVPLDLEQLGKSLCGLGKSATDTAAGESRSEERQMMLRVANEALGDLPEYLREVYELTVFACLGSAEIARLLDKNPVTVRVYLSHARKEIGRRVEELLTDEQKRPHTERNNEDRGDHE
jgi:RNA polymerase sigma factor (sigma-70 family)